MDNKPSIPQDAWDDGIREIARLLNLWSEREFTPVVEETLCAWCQETASRTRLPPHPENAIVILQELSCLSKDSEGHLTPDREIAVKSGERRRLDELAPGVAEILFLKMLGYEACRPSFDVVLSGIPFTGQQLKFEWTQIHSACRKEAAWIWLQQLGLCRNDGVTVEISPVLEPYVAQSVPRGRPVPLEELERRLALQAKMASDAEEYIVSSEKYRLSRLGKEQLAQDVHRVSLDDVTAGYDVLSFEHDGKVRRIEVKSSAGPRLEFFISRNEIETAERFGPSYFLAWVGFASRLPAGPVEVAWFQDPASILNAAFSPWRTTTEHFRIRRVADDTEYFFHEPR